MFSQLVGLILLLLFMFPSFFFSRLGRGLVCPLGLVQLIFFTSLGLVQILTNFLSSIMIHATRPFVLNDWIQTKIQGYDVSGTVEVNLSSCYQLDNKGIYFK